MAGRRCSRSASGPRLKRCTKSATCRSRLLVGEVVPRASAQRAACSKAQAATGTATVTNTNCRARRLVLVRMLMPPFVATKSIAGRIERLARQQVEHDGEHHRGDDREQDHQQASRPAAQGRDLDASRAHLWLLLRPRVIGCSTGRRRLICLSRIDGVLTAGEAYSGAGVSRHHRFVTCWSGLSGHPGPGRSAWRYRPAPGRAPGSSPWRFRWPSRRPLGRPACPGQGPPGWSP